MSDNFLVRNKSAGRLIRFSSDMISPSRRTSSLSKGVAKARLSLSIRSKVLLEGTLARVFYFFIADDDLSLIIISENYSTRSSLYEDGSTYLTELMLQRLFSLIRLGDKSDTLPCSKAGTISISRSTTLLNGDSR